MLPDVGVGRRMARGRATLVLLLAAPLGIPVQPSLPQRHSDDLANRLRNRIEAAGMPPAIVVGDELVHASAALSEFYERRGFQPAWVQATGASDLVPALVRAIRASFDEGLEPDDYHLERILSLGVAVRRPGSDRPPKLVDLELLCTDAFLLLGSHYLSGRVNPESFDPEWKANRRGARLDLVLDSAIADRQIAGHLAALLPAQSGYALLRQALAEHRRTVSDGGWPGLPATLQLSVDDRGEEVVQLRRRLAAAGRVRDVPVGDSLVFDEPLADEVRAFQARHGLAVTGMVDSVTAAALYVPVEDRLQQIALNLERWRWLPQDLGARHIRVNIAGFDLDAVEDGRAVLSMRVMVGRTYRRTPVFSEQMTYLVFAPFWNVPHNLAVQDQLPLIRRDPQHFTRLGIRVLEGWGAQAREIDPATVDWATVRAEAFPYRLRQDPGPQNALGQVKFMFPNKFNVYLHDTPARALFDNPQRDFSSGCIRLEHPIELAEFVLASQVEWTRARIVEASERREEQTVRLSRQVPVHILYWTAWVGADGVVHFRRDIYGRDRLLAVALGAEPPSGG